jgi:hypothetical protein
MEREKDNPIILDEEVARRVASGELVRFEPLPWVDVRVSVWMNLMDRVEHAEARRRGRRP